ncbi:DHS-like NAD/FAD-binding domain-containing protein [Plectosphaerella plurivora]|uniref:Probable electron transfer flavoprotein subunit alpha n=1 Tax=Plectosphaerella plurivora TaxID=936078 RepID=A0A9P9A7Q9_9PEZI|nr:DHS-like NAD/FAD-binding domain-containing protein [Plectosphaerella plurivora]
MFSRQVLRRLAILPVPRLNHSTAATLRRHASTLVVLEARDGKLTPDALSAIAAATNIQGPVSGLVLANASGDTASDEASKLEHLDTVLVPQESTTDYRLSEHAASLVAKNAKEGGHTHVIAAHSVFGRDVIPRAAALLGIQPISNVMSIAGDQSDTFTRPIYAGNALMTLQSTESIKFLTVRPSSFPAAPSSQLAEPKPIQHVTEASAARTCTWIGEDLLKTDRPDLGTSARVVSGGRGLRSKEDFDALMTPLADSLGAAIGASRAAVDSGYADNSLQVGQTGAVVAPQLYLAVGISGAIQHLAGMKDSKVIAAVNKDPDAPIFQVADIGLVGDLYEVVPELSKQMQ